MNKKVAILSCTPPAVPNGMGTYVHHLIKTIDDWKLFTSQHYKIRSKSNKAESVYRENKNKILQEINSSFDVVLINWSHFEDEDAWVMEELIDLIKIPKIYVVQSIIEVDFDYIREQVSLYFPHHKINPISLNFQKRSILYSRKLYEIANKVVVISQNEKNLWKKYYPEDDFSKFEVIYNAIENPIIDKTNIKKNKHLGYFGRIVYRKGILTSLSVMDYLKDYDFWIYGEKNDSFARAMFESFMDRQNIHYLGVLKKKNQKFINQLKNYYKLISLSLLNSLYEPFGFSHVESMTNGVFPIIGKNTGTSEVFGYDYPFQAGDDVQELKSKIIEYNNTHISDLYSLADKIEEKFNWFSIERFKKRYSDLFNSI